MLTANHIKSKPLKLLFQRGDESKIHARWRGKVKRILNALDIAVSPVEMPRLAYNPHEMKGDRKGVYSVTVSRNWRITYKWDDQGPYDVEMEDYHGQ